MLPEIDDIILVMEALRVEETARKCSCPERKLKRHNDDCESMVMVRLTITDSGWKLTLDGESDDEGAASGTAQVARWDDIESMESTAADLLAQVEEEFAMSEEF